ncbi:MAG: ATP-binding cassette domain-containing protein [Betaproteobacteria bacterium]|nr:ATP-binding cassette domain-containing protein [Betaproteobacteria bacterium]
MGPGSELLLKLDGVSKFFPGVKALDSVCFDVLAGEVHGLVGENGAGKSTLMGVASGALIADEGRVEIAGREMRGDPELARNLGLAIVRQEPALMPDLTVAENLYLGVPERCRPTIAMSVGWATQLLRTWSDDVPIDAYDRVASLAPGQRFIIEIVKALASEPRVLVLDEPTEHLLAEDVERLFARIKNATGKGVAVAYISHRIREVQKIAERLTILRDGKSQGTYNARAMDEQHIVELIVGRELDREFPPKAGVVRSNPAVLEVKELHGPGFSDISMEVRQSEIVGLAGIDGNGQREFIRALASITKRRGLVRVNSRDLDRDNLAAASQAGIRYLPGDRHQEGILAELSVRENFSLRSLKQDVFGGLLSRRNEAERAQQSIWAYTVKTPSIETPICALSGGNQQKLVLASVLASEPKVLLVDEPTQGVDVGARMEIYRILRETAARGAAIVVVSSDGQELAGLCDRVLIFSRGHIVKELSGSDVVEHNITTAILTSTTVRERAPAQTANFWRWAAGDTAPAVTLALSVILLGIYASFVNEFYLSARNMSGILPLIATLAIVAYGQQLLMLAGGIDLSVGPLMGLILVAQSFLLVSDASPSHQAIGWALVILIAVVVGLLNWLLADPIGLHPMVATLVTFMLLQAVSLLLRPVPGGIIADDVMESVGYQIGFVPVAILGAIALGLALEHGLFRRSWGLILRGFGSRPEAARVAGVRPRLVLVSAYVGCSVLAGIASIPMMAQIGTGDPNAGIGYTLASLAAVVIGGASLFGGRGSFVGALLGATLITQVNVVTAFLGLTDAWQSYLLGGMILVSVAFYSKSRQMAVAK